MGKIRVETNEDSLFLEGEKIHAVTAGEEYIFDLEDVVKMVILTTDMGPMYCDMGLAVDVGNGNVIFIMSDHRCYKSFLFDQIGKALPIDYQKVIEAASCIDNQVFLIYEKKNQEETAS
ncbi:hypothetical protein bpr_IV191 (plasmid) [Butyrivibrio proteoclasticus B316]|uniref:Uncharacterized protein n=1 Tax=Butyrivibrio proteoclasticus (strain ATCC 51982 / DSM 14932 / B316) TaxID=515622 RepID=E0S573_BUTPB|nr:hypothetical protein [Butyrivibrio proteoclasticus]ADL36555.1 hypothetical protein bpr_IV191 [Butyrivibrio proteoclasticus B316]